MNLYGLFVLTQAHSGLCPHHAHCKPNRTSRFAFHPDIWLRASADRSATRTTRINAVKGLSARATLPAVQPADREIARLRRPESLENSAAANPRADRLAKVEVRETSDVW